MKAFYAFIIGLTLCSPSFAQVARSDTGTPSINSVSSNVLTLNLSTETVPAGSTCLVATLNTSNTPLTPTLTWDSTGTPQAMTMATVKDETTNGWTGIWVLPNPHTGTLNLNATWLTTGRIASLGAIAFSGTDTTTCVNALNTTSTTGTSTAPTITITDSANGAVVGSCTITAHSITAIATGTSVYRDTTVAGATAYNLGLTNAGVVTFTAGASGVWGCVGVNVIVGSGGGAGPKRLTTMGAGL